MQDTGNWVLDIGYQILVTVGIRHWDSHILTLKMLADILYVDVKDFL